ncbi:FecR domain-containing protein [Candidatus Daviesbacteria bacterium]|nr:FecR domain-containing protein [Candidatus Daviesbacteria bacterium]
MPTFLRQGHSAELSRSPQDKQSGISKKFPPTLELRWAGILPTVLLFFFVFASNVFATERLDCNKALIESTKGRTLSSDWSNPGVPGSVYAVNNIKEKIEKTNEGACILKRTWNVNGSITHFQEVKMTYYSNGKDAADGMSQIRSSESGDFTVKSSTDKRYSGSIYRDGVYQQVLDGGIMGYKGNGPLYSRTVDVVGNCLVQAISQLNTDYVYADKAEYESTFVEPFLRDTEGFADGMSKHQEVLAFCGSGKSGGEGGLFGLFQKPQQPQSDRADQAKPTELEKSSSKDQTKGGPLPVFVGEWFKAISGALEANLVLDDVAIIVWTGRTPEQLAKTERQISFIESLDEDFVWRRTGTDIDDIISKIEHEPGLANDFIGKLKDDVEFKPPQIIKEQRQQAYEFLKDVEIDENGKPVLIQMPQGTMRLSPSSRQKAILKYKGNTPVLESGQLEVLEETKGENPTKIETPTAEIFVIGTNFLVSVNGKSKDSAILVYEGQVEVKTKDGKKAIVSPDGNQPGVVFILRESSPVKLALIGLLLAAVFGGIIFLLKIKFTSKELSKKRR